MSNEPNPIDRVIQRIDEFQADVELRFTEVNGRFDQLRDQIATMNTALSVTSAVLARHLQDHES